MACSYVTEEVKTQFTRIVAEKFTWIQKKIEQDDFLGSYQSMKFSVSWSKGKVGWFISLVSNIT